MFKSTFATGVVLALAFGTGIPAAAYASAPVETVSRTVRFGDLNLSNEKDARTLLKRINYAARHVCTSEYSRWADRSCVRQATSKAVSDVGSPMVSALYTDDRVQIAQK